jgi:hypothetical protein
MIFKEHRRMGEMKLYAVIKNPKKPKGDPDRYLIAKTWILPFLISDASILGLFDTLEAALDFLVKLM